MTPEQYLAKLEWLSLNGEFQAALDFSRAHPTLELSRAQSIQAGTILSHALVQLRWEGAPSDLPSSGREAMPDGTGRSDEVEGRDGGDALQTPADEGRNGVILSVEGRALREDPQRNRAG
jgi:hypothetical protein